LNPKSLLMKKISTITLLSSVLIFILSFLFLLYIKSGGRDIEIRVEWYTKAVQLLLLGCCLLFTISLAVKSIISQKRGWKKLILILIYSVVFVSFGLFFLLEGKSSGSTDGKLILSVIIYTFLVLLLLFFYKRYIWIKWFLFAHSMLLFIILSYSFIKVLQYSSDKYVETDKYVLYKSMKGKQYVVVQGEGSDEALYYIDKDFGIYRTRMDFDPEMLYGKWKQFNKHNKPVAIVEFENGEAVNKEYVLSKNSFIVENTNDLFKILNKSSDDSLSILLKNDLEIDRPLIIRNKRNMRIAGIYDRGYVKILNKEDVTAFVEESKNVCFENIEFHSEMSSTNMSLINSANIQINNCKFTGFVENGLVVDSLSENISIKNSSFSRYTAKGILAFNQNALIENNTYKTKQSKIELLGKKFDVNLQLEIVNELLFANGSVYDESDRDVTELNGVFHPMYSGTFEELYYRNRFHEKLKKYVHTEFCNDCGCAYLYCFDFLSILSDIPLINTTKEGWGWNNDGSSKFLHVNPEFFTWIRVNSKFTGLEKVNNVSLKAIYHSWFKEIFRNYVSAYKQLHAQADYYQKINEYKDFVDAEYYDIHSFIYYRFIPERTIVNEAYYGEGHKRDSYQHDNWNVSLYESTINLDNRELSADNVTKIHGFWIRRELDGSALEIYNTLVYFMSVFDDEML